MNQAYLIKQLAEVAAKVGLEFDEEILRQAVNFSQFRVVPKGEILKRIGDHAQTVGIVLDGLVRSYYVDSDGNDITRGFAGVGGMCLDEGMMGYQQHICMWETLEASTLMISEVHDLEALISGDEHLKSIWINLLKSSIRYKLYRENGFLTETATERYLHFKRRYPELSNSIPQKHIATYLGITPESLSRIKAAMREE